MFYQNIYWNPTVAMKPTSSSLLAPEVVKMTTPGKTRDDKFGVVTTLCFGVSGSDPGDAKKSSVVKSVLKFRRQISFKWFPQHTFSQMKSLIVIRSIITLTPENQSSIATKTFSVIRWCRSFSKSISFLKHLQFYIFASYRTSHDHKLSIYDNTGLIIWGKLHANYMAINLLM